MRTQWVLVVVVDMTEVFTVPCEEPRSNSTTPNTAHVCTRTCSVEKSRLFQLSGTTRCLSITTASPYPCRGKARQSPWAVFGRMKLRGAVCPELSTGGHRRAVLWGPLDRLPSFGRLWPTSWVLNESFHRLVSLCPGTPSCCLSSRAQQSLDLTSFSGCPT